MKNSQNSAAIAKLVKDSSVTLRWWDGQTGMHQYAKVHVHVVLKFLK
jgi:hypothetical protein